MIADSPNTLASYAVQPAASLGRIHAEEGLADRDPFELDRLRIFASPAFRRLQYKTQVFVTDEHDHFRTRLTHTLEVAQIARRLARALRANEYLAESVALAHDLGHPPFGHAGEATLRELMAGDGGFEHNIQALRIVDYLEHPFPGFRGLNLTFELREGLAKHATEFDRPDMSAAAGVDVSDLIESGPQASVEAQLVNAADRIAYDCHDLEDAIGAQLIGETDLEELALWSESANAARERYGKANLFAIRRPVLNAVVDRMVADCARATSAELERIAAGDVDDVRAHSQSVVTFSETEFTNLRELEGFLAERVYRHYRLVRMDAKARRFIEQIFAAYVQDPAMLPPRFARRLDAHGVKRVVCDYIAGMTDRYCQDEYQRLFEPHERV